MAFLALVGVVIAMLDWYLTQWATDRYVHTLQETMHREAQLVANLIADEINGPVDTIRNTTRQISEALDRRVTIIRADGLVLADSEHDPADMTNHRNRSEVLDALRHGHGSSVRFSATIGEKMLYVAERIGPAGSPLGVSRLTVSLAKMDQARDQIRRAFLAGGSIAALLAALFSIIITTRISAPVHHMTAVARRLAHGHFNERIAVNHLLHDEIDELAEALNTMAHDLQMMMMQLSAEKRKLQVVYERTYNGLLLLDREQVVQLANPAARSLLHYRGRMDGLRLADVPYTAPIVQLVSRAMRTNQPASLDIDIPEINAFMNVYCAPFDVTEGHRGVLVVMHDLSEQRKSDEIRRDFVANVSHELRTPLASVRAMAETIQMRSRTNPAIASEYAEKIMAEIDRLTALSDDLLDLAAIEAGRRTITFERINLAEIAGHVLMRLQPVARERQITLTSRIPLAMYAHGDADAILQILINLVDNAVKYTSPGGQVWIEAFDAEDQTHITVADTGIGIPQEDLPRIFERFYRVDKARSRASGGTGLGLAIVKHLVEAMGGKVSVESVVNEGSRFTISLPHA